LKFPTKDRQLFHLNLLIKGDDAPLDNLDDQDSQNTEALLNICAELKRGLSRLSFVGMGITDELDKELAQLRKVIKQEGEIDDVKGSIDSISKILRTLDDDSDEKEVSNANQRLDLLSLLLKNQLPKALKNDLKQVQKKSKTGDAAAIMRSIAGVIQTYVSQVESEQNSHQNETPTAKKSGFLTGLFSKKDRKSEPEEKNIPLTESEASTTLPIADNDISLPQKVRDSLQLLIDQLSSMDGYSEIADLLNTEINKIKNIEQLSSILEMITGAFIEISDQEHVQFEKFLKTLNTRIVRVNEFINQTLKFSQGSNKDSKQLNLDLNNNLSGMKDSLSNSVNLDEAKTAVFSHMDTIVNQINQYCIKQETNSEVLVSQMDKLSEQLRATEDEASRLKDDLAEQRVRAQTDPLTHLPNRYCYNERLTQEYNRWRRYRHSLTLVIGDIDLFKKVNDDHGHAFGDKVLREIANYLAASIRESDFIARFGGEEFVILLPETAIVDATRAMNKMRSGIAKLEIENGGTIVPVSMSFGISEFENDDTTKAVFERADKALYRAKEKGRNLVCCQRAKNA